MNRPFRIVPKAPTTGTSLPSPILILGPAHSGKSELAHGFLDATQPATIIGTGTLDDPWIAKRVAELQSQRPPHWPAVLCERELVSALQAFTMKAQQILVDSLNLWLGAVAAQLDQKQTFEESEQTINRQVDGLIHYLTESPARMAESKGRMVLVSAESGAGGPPPRQIDRIFRLGLGLLNRRLAAFCPTVVLVSAGIPLVIKGPKA